MKQTSADIRSKFVDDTKICQIETPSDNLICYTYVYLYSSIYSCAPEGGCCV